MSENNTPLIGTPVSLTVFVVDYVFTKAPRKAKLPKSAKSEDDKVYQTAVVTTGDPSGQDVFGIAKRLVLGANPYEGNDFKVLKSVRAFEAIGLAQVTSWDKLDGHAGSNGEIVVEEEGEGDDESSTDPKLN